MSFATTQIDYWMLLREGRGSKDGTEEGGWRVQVVSADGDSKR